MIQFYEKKNTFHDIERFKIKYNKLAGKTVYELTNKGYKLLNDLHLNKYVFIKGC